MKLQKLFFFVSCLLGATIEAMGPQGNYPSKEACEKNCSGVGGGCFYSRPTPPQKDPFRVDIGIHREPGWYCEYIN